MFQVFLSFFFKLLNIINFNIFTIYLLNLTKKKSRMRTNLMALNFNMFIKKETDAENTVLEKKMKSLNYKTYRS